MLQRLRNPQLIRSDALAMGQKKAQQGCLECAQGYFDLAKQHGATPEEIQEAIAKASMHTDALMKRRTLLKSFASATTLTALTAAEHLAEGSDQALAAPALQTWWGTDSNTQSAGGMPQNFYIGRMGYGTEATGDGNFFNVSAAQRAGHNRTYGYWVVAGPNAKPNSMSSYAWGQQQASCAWAAWNHGPHEANIGGLTIFADIEPGGGGWQNGNFGPNQQVLEGFLHGSLSQNNAAPGVYISPRIWDNFFGAGFRTSVNFVLWLTGVQTCVSSICPPCNTQCNTLIGVRAHLTSGVANISISSQKPVVWQYWIGSCGCGDYNVMLQNATALVPIGGHLGKGHISRK